MSDETILRQSICEIGRRMYDKGFVAANDGNISLRLADGTILTTPTGVSKGYMTPESMVRVDLTGRVLSAGRPSSELLMHLFVYRERPEVHAVVHAHPIHATGFATAGIALDACVAAEIIATLGSIPLAAYGTPSTHELPETLRPHIHHSDAFLLANHGVVAVGKTLMEAYDRLERVEHYAHIVLIARQLGGERQLPHEEVQKLFALRDKYGQTGLNPGCAVCDEPCLGSVCLNYDEKYLSGSTDQLGAVVDRIVARLRAVAL